MEESTTYQAIMRKGRVEQARRNLLIVGEVMFGPADEATRAAIEAISDLAQLEELLVRQVSANSWQELVALPTPRRRNGRRKKS